MKKLVVFLAAALILTFSASAWAIADDGADSFGLYYTGSSDPVTSDPGSNTCPQAPFYLRRALLHMIIANPTEENVSGFEMGFAFTTDNPYFEIRGYVNEPTTYLDFGTSVLDYAVGFSTPQAVSGDFFYLGALQTDLDDLTDTSETQIWGCPGASPSIAGYAVYTGSIAATKVRMNWSTGARDEVTGCSPEPLMWLNCDPDFPPVAAEDETWTNVKDLYR